MLCPYCNNEAKWCENKEIYGKNYGKSYMCYYCQPCDAYVGCHLNTTRPLGTLANKELRHWRVKAHESIDGLWKSGVYKRREIYRALDKLFYPGKGKQHVHIGESDIEMCKQIIKKFKPL